jgi:hypothetical protein
MSSPASSTLTPRTRIKICGLKEPAHARVAAEAGADAIGLVFYGPSPRNVEIAQAKAVAQALRGALKVPVPRLRELRCAVAYPLEDVVRRECALAGASLLEVSHGAVVALRLSLDESQAARFIDRVNQLSKGSVRWGV